MAAYYNITSSITQQLISESEGKHLETISLCNVQDTSASFSLYMQKDGDSEGKFFLLRSTMLYGGSTFEKHFNYLPNGFGYFLKIDTNTGSAPSVDVVLKSKK